MRLVATILVTALAASAQVRRTTTVIEPELGNAPPALVTLIRSVADDPTIQRTRLTGTPEQIDLVYWLLQELNQRGARSRRPSEIFEFDGSYVRIFYPTFTSTPEQFTEVVNIIQVMSDMRWVLPYTPRGAIVTRGDAQQIELTRWLLDELARRSESITPHSASTDFVLTGHEQPIVRLFYTAHTASDSELADLAAVIRTLTETKRLIQYSALRTIIARGAKDEMELVHWFFDQLDPPGPGTRVSRERVVAGADLVVRVLFPRDIAAAVEGIRSRADWAGVTVLAYRGVLAVRGPLAQVLEIERLVNPN